VGSGPALVDPPEAQRRFVAFAAHELRAEIALQRTLAEVTLADPEADAAALRAMGEKVAAACERQDRLLDALLTLARSEHGRLRREPVDLSAIVAEAVRAGPRHELTRSAALRPARIRGDPELIQRLVANLVANAIRHNVPSGRLDVVTHTSAGRARFTIANTGPVIPAGELTRLFEPFQRLRRRTGHRPEGVGLGLAIVRAIAEAHDASLAARPRAGGGLEVAVEFPAEIGTGQPSVEPIIAGARSSPSMS